MGQAKHQAAGYCRLKLRLAVQAVGELKFSRIHRQMSGQAAAHQYPPELKLFCPGWMTVRPIAI
jgi:hypothetical protein